MRIEKFLADSGLGSRKEVKQFITAGIVKVNDQLIKKVGYAIDPKKDRVTVHDELVRYQKYFYVLLNKPKGIVSATKDDLHQTVIDWVGAEYAHCELFPVGRLDRDTTGLLLLTNNGAMAHQLLSPNKKIPKRYAAKIKGQVTNQDIQQFARGLDLGDFITKPAELVIMSVDVEHDLSDIEVTIHEGKFHQVKRMFEKVGKQVLALHRLTMGPLQLPTNLEVGEWRELTEEEQQLLIPYGLIQE